MIHHASGLHVAAAFPMSEAVRFVLGGAGRNLWPIFLAPAAAALAADSAARRLPRTPGSAAPAALLAAIPGLVALSALAAAVTTWGPFTTWRGLLLYRVTPAIALALIGLAAFRLAGRWREVRRLFGLAEPPGPRLHAAASRAGLRALELRIETPECFLAGVLRPTVFVSRGALARLDDAELAAALDHERAHAGGRDTAALTLLGVLRDLAPYGRGAAMAAFQAAREASADTYAASRSGALHHAAALLALARPAPSRAAVLPMAAADTVGWRLERLLGEASAVDHQHRIDWRLAGAAAFLAWPAVQYTLFGMFCG
jgi:hypothetical protein